MCLVSKIRYRLPDLVNDNIKKVIEYGIWGIGVGIGYECFLYPGLLKQNIKIHPLLFRLLIALIITSLEQLYYGKNISPRTFPGRFVGRVLGYTIGAELLRLYVQR